MNPVPTPLPRIARFGKLGFGLFIHYGHYSQMGAGEWLSHGATSTAWAAG